MTKALFALSSLLFAFNSFAGDKVGNGAGLWTCSPYGVLRQGFLVDLYEAQEEFDLDLISSTTADPMSLVEERREYVRRHLPQYSVAWERVFTASLSKIRLVASELTIVDDALYRIKPLLNCPVSWEYTQFANFTNQDQILIRADLWNSSQISNVDKAALIWHEVVYKWLRDQYQEKDSVRTRQVVGLIFSTLPPSLLQDRLAQVLKPSTPPRWICMVRNEHISWFYAGEGAKKSEAETRALYSCHQGDYGFFCDERGVKCEEILTTEASFSCQNKNAHIGRIYLGQGRSPLEAEFKAREACQSGPHKFFCDKEVICE